MAPLYERYKETRPIGVHTITNTFGLLVFEPLEEDRYDCELVSAWSTMEGCHGYHRHQISYTPSGRAFIRKGQTRFYLDEIMRTA